MFSVRKRVIYAIAIVMVVSAAGGQVVRSSAIETELGLHRRYIEPDLQALVRSGILNSLRGPSGGYTLGRNPDRITIRHIIDAISVSPDEPEPMGHVGEFLMGHVGALADRANRDAADARISDLEKLLQNWHPRR